MTRGDTLTSPLERGVDRPGSMRLSRPARRLILTIHVAGSVAYVGVMSVMGVLALQAVRSLDGQVAGEMIRAGQAILPVAHISALSAFVSGVVLSLGTVWGLVRHWWVFIKLVVTLALTVTGFVVIRRFLDGAAASGEAATGLVGASFAHATLAVLATILSIYKPFGRMRHATAAGR